MADVIVEALILIIKSLLIFTFVWVVLSYFFSSRRTFGNIIKTWYQTFANQQFSSQEFYTLMEQAIREKRIPHVAVDRVTYRDVSYLGSRVYLQVLRNDQLILVCAAMFGTDYYISYRQGQPIDFMQDMVMRVPKIGPLLARVMFNKTFYQQDTDVMFQEAIHQCVLTAIGHLTNPNVERVPLEPVQEGGQPNIEYV